MRTVLDLFDSNIKKARPLTLDCGCGRGVYAYKSSNGSYVGLDVNIPSIKLAHDLHPNDMFIVGDAIRLPFKDQVFDCVICSEVLEHIANDKAVLVELARVSKVLGKLIVSVPALECNNVFVNWQRSLIDAEVGHFRRGYPLSDILKLIAGSGFTVTGVKRSCGPLTAIAESFVIKLGGLFGYKPSKLNQLFEEEKVSLLVKIALKVYKLLFPLVIFVTYLDKLLPKACKSNIAILTRRTYEKDMSHGATSSKLRGETEAERKEKLLVSVIVPTHNSARTLETCLESIKDQTYKNIELIVVDNHSTDETRAIAQKYTDMVFDKGPERNIQRPYGASIAKGDYLLFIDSDMELPLTLVESAVRKCENERCDAAILPEVSVGAGFWADCRKLEKLCYLNDSYMELANRFMKKEVYHAVGGYDETFIGADDWDINEKIKRADYKIGRIEDAIKHHEAISITKMLRSSYLYGQDIPFYMKKYPKLGMKQFFIIRPAYLKNLRLFIKDPIHGVGLMVMKSLQYLVGGLGFLMRLLRGWSYKV